MKILMLTSVYSTGWGVGLVVDKTAESLYSYGHDVLIATSESVITASGKSVITISEISYEAVCRLVKAYRPDAVISHTPPFYDFVGRMADIDCIKVAYDYGEPFPFLFDGIERNHRQNIDQNKYHNWIPEFHVHICISNFVKCCSGFRKSYVIYPGGDHIEMTDAGEIIRKKRDIKTKMITSLFRIGTGESRYKGVEVLREVKRRLNEDSDAPECRFMVVGRLGEGGSAVKKELEHQGFHVMTDISEEEKSVTLSVSDVYLSPSLWEGFDLPLVEAQYLGIPAVALSTGAHPEVCPFHYSRIEELVYSLKLMLIDDEYRKRCADTCRKYVTDKFTWKKNGEMLISVLEEAVQKKQKGMLNRLGIREHEYAESAARNAEIVNNYLKMTDVDAEAKPDGGFIRLFYKLTDKKHISIIIPSKNHYEELKRCISSIFERSSYPYYDIVIIDNGSDEIKLLEYYDELIKAHENIKIYSYNKKFNFSSMINLGVCKSNSEYLLFLNNDTEVISRGWLEEILGICQRDDVGAVGAKLYFPDGKIQHAGIILGVGGVAANAYRNFPGSARGYMSQLLTIRNVSAVTAACMMTKRSVFNKAGGFDEKLAVAFNDVDYCLKVRKLGYLIVWTPYAELYHHEMMTRGQDITPKQKKRFSGEITMMQKKWSPILYNDPYFSNNIPINELIWL